MRQRPLVLVVLVFLAACGSAPIITHVEHAEVHPPPVALDDPAPALRLPDDVAPTHYALSLKIDPAQERFQGDVSIDVTLQRDRAVVWLHAQDMHVTQATITPDGGTAFAATMTTTDHDGVTALRGDQPIPAGHALLHILYDAPFDRTLKGLYRVDVGQDHYAYTQFEAISARYAFPCFDESRFKTPFEVTLTVPTAATPISNTHAIADEAGEGFHTVHFAPTLPLPTYLIAFAVGPFDVVEATPIPANATRTTPIPLRGVTVRGRGPEVRYALEHTADIVGQLEDYFGIPYPYDKLDLIAVPDFAAGAMENAGAITFRDVLLLLDPVRAPEEQVRRFVGVTAHELAHQWFGDLVTMPWWDDIWLNEAFATWMGERVVERLHPEWHSELGALAGIEGAMESDSLVAARRVREPIVVTNDISNAFDGITYQKGGGVLAMFEHFMGEDVFRRGIQSYLAAHRFGVATSDDLMTALSASAGRDIGTPFRTFLDQPGVPVVHASVECPDGGPPSLHVTQERFFPVGSTGSRDAHWQIPLCLRYPGDAGAMQETCQLVTETDAHVPLTGAASCPAWVMPNDGGHGYYRFTLGAEDLAHLGTAGYSRLAPREKLAYADAVTSGFVAGTIHADSAYPALAPLVHEQDRALVNAPMGLLRFAREYVVDATLRPRVEAWARTLYAPLVRDLGWTPRHGATEDGERKLLRASVLYFTAMVARDPAVRREAARRGRAWLGPANGAVDPNAVAPELADLAVLVALQDGDATVFDLALARLHDAVDSIVRSRLLAALGAVHDDALATRALGLTIDPALRVNEALTPFSVQMDQLERREAAWTWLEGNYQPVAGRIGDRAGYLPWMARFCDDAHAARVESFFRGHHIETVPGGQRNLAGATENIRLCAARVGAQGESVRAFFGPAHH